MKKSSKKPSINAGLAQLFEKLDLIHESVNNLDKKLELLTQKTHYEFEQIRTLDTEQNALLAEHAQRSTELARANDLLESAMNSADTGLSDRIDSLEQPRKIVATVFRWTVAGCTGLAAVAGLIYAILRLMGI